MRLIKEEKRLLIAALAVLLIQVGMFVGNFTGMPFSTQTSDWGAFADYMGLGIGAISIGLLYITFREQRRTNQIAAFKRWLYTAYNTVKELQAKHLSEIRKDEESISIHFNPCCHLSEKLRQADCQIAVRCYYNEMKFHNGNRLGYESFLAYLDYCVHYVSNSSMSNQMEILTGLFSIVESETRVLLVGYLLHRERTIRLNEFVKYGLLHFEPRDLKDNRPYASALNVACGGHPINEKDNGGADDVDVPDRRQEPFQDTLKRIRAKNSQKPQGHHE